MPNIEKRIKKLIDEKKFADAEKLLREDPSLVLTTRSGGGRNLVSLAIKHVHFRTPEFNSFVLLALCFLCDFRRDNIGVLTDSGFKPKYGDKSIGKSTAKKMVNFLQDRDKNGLTMLDHAIVKKIDFLTGILFYYAFADSFPYPQVVQTASDFESVMPISFQDWRENGYPYWYHPIFAGMGGVVYSISLKMLKLARQNDLGKLKQPIIKDIYLLRDRFFWYLWDKLELTHKETSYTKFICRDKETISRLLSRSNSKIKGTWMESWMHGTFFGKDKKCFDYALEYFLYIAESNDIIYNPTQYDDSLITRAFSISDLADRIVIRNDSRLFDLFQSASSRVKKIIDLNFTVRGRPRPFQEEASALLACDYSASYAIACFFNERSTWQEAFSRDHFFVKHFNGIAELRYLEGRFSKISNALGFYLKEGFFILAGFSSNLGFLEIFYTSCKVRYLEAEDGRAQLKRDVESLQIAQVNHDEIYDLIEQGVSAMTRPHGGEAVREFCSTSALRRYKFTYNPEAQDSKALQESIFNDELKDYEYIDAILTLYLTLFWKLFPCAFNAFNDFCAWNICLGTDYRSKITHGNKYAWSKLILDTNDQQLMTVLPERALFSVESILFLEEMVSRNQEAGADTMLYEVALALLRWSFWGFSYNREEVSILFLYKILSKEAIFSSLLTYISKFSDDCHVSAGLAEARVSDMADALVFIQKGLGTLQITQFGAEATQVVDVIKTLSQIQVYQEHMDTIPVIVEFLQANGLGIDSTELASRVLSAASGRQLARFQMLCENLTDLNIKFESGEVLVDFLARCYMFDFLLLLVKQFKELFVLAKLVNAHVDANRESELEEFNDDLFESLSFSQEDVFFACCELRGYKFVDSFRTRMSGSPEALHAWFKAQKISGFDAVLEALGGDDEKTKLLKAAFCRDNKQFAQCCAATSPLDVQFRSGFKVTNYLLANKKFDFLSLVLDRYEDPDLCRDFIFALLESDSAQAYETLSLLERSSATPEAFFRQCLKNEQYFLMLKFNALHPSAVSTVLQEAFDFPLENACVAACLTSSESLFDHLLSKGDVNPYEVLNRVYLEIKTLNLSFEEEKGLVQTALNFCKKACECLSTKPAHPSLYFVLQELSHYYQLTEVLPSEAHFNARVEISKSDQEFLVAQATMLMTFLAKVVAEPNREKSPCIPYLNARSQVFGGYIAAIEACNCFQVNDLCEEYARLADLITGVELDLVVNILKAPLRCHDKKVFSILGQIHKHYEKKGQSADDLLSNLYCKESLTREVDDSAKNSRMDLFFFACESGLRTLSRKVLGTIKCDISEVCWRKIKSMLGWSLAEKTHFLKHMSVCESRVDFSDFWTSCSDKEIVELLAPGYFNKAINSLAQKGSTPRFASQYDFSKPYKPTFFAPALYQYSFNSSTRDYDTVSVSDAEIKRQKNESREEEVKYAQEMEKRAEKLAPYYERVSRMKTI
jgi:hypothetical protein